MNNVAANFKLVEIKIRKFSRKMSGEFASREKKSLSGKPP